MFKEETGITVNYNDEINANDAFFGELLPQLQAGQDTGRDIIVITNGREFTALIANGWVTELDPSLRPNFDANAATWAKDPDFDPGNKYSMAWQSGLTGIGVEHRAGEPADHEAGRPDEPRHRGHELRRHARRATCPTS